MTHPALPDCDEISFSDPRVTANILAAGAVLWRRAPDGCVEVALVHRPKYDDWSLPKGKLDPGETPMVAAVREVAEETGLRCRLGRYLGHVTYPVTGHRKLKRVDYWAATVTDGTFIANPEVDELTWQRVDGVMEALSYPMDRHMVRNFLRLPPDTATLLLVRHGKAGRRDRFTGDDDERPLDRTGRAQARALAPNLLAFGAADIYSAPPLRCVQTMEPLTEQLGGDIRLEPLLSETGYAAAPDAALARMRELVSTDTVRAICSQGKVIPDLLARWAETDGVALPPARNRKGSAWVLSFSDGRLVAADHLDRALRTE
ncbi:NUDIX hydrolase [Nocardia terpenica]|uniref:NUDIX hydrolase n=1 Tax=Nocardia terpenica TaxID=455432 RepID=UPI000A7D16BA|nr:bifunctional NUDIX hydrolase/histidine phosphatase family protein [Nocardia terpenica]MBF6063829.1 NUDIX hydrolase [Nocardia terpenica]MBF6108519.1 NUDIX hydrolase [Nocardia terpenica]MBF6116065.1 NUDIX hydrolase [Nocardia terpenica]MBF6121010.1 NUDIX hydrolase [Nocardia terpenica]MBF6156718.1 NUDIX hydrolase [Nocardia terpenica]